MATALRLEKRPALWPLAVGAKRRKKHHITPVLTLNCRVCPPRPKPQLLYPSRSSPSHSQSTLSGTRTYEASDSASPRYPVAADVSEHPGKRVVHDEWPVNNCPHSAKTAFLMECRTGASSYASYSSVSSIRITDDVAPKRKSSPMTAILRLISKLKSDPREQTIKSLAASVQLVDGRVRLEGDSRSISSCIHRN